ncbi:MAG: copper amine oxidase N-terminal domain-containing protein [Candidatus Pristimantibacillus sp.]
MNKPFIALLLAIMMILTVPAAAGAAAAKEVTVYVAGKKVKYAQAPITENGTTLVSARETIEALGLTFSWDKGNKRIIGTNGEMTVAIVLGEYTATANGVSVFLGTPAVEKNGRIMVPLRFLLDSVGATMETKANQINVKTASKEKSKYYTGLPLEITNTTVKNLSKESITVNYVEYLYKEDGVYTVDYSLELAAGKKQAFENSSATLASTVEVDYEEYAFFGRAVKSITVGETETASKSFKKADDIYLNGSFETNLMKIIEKNNEESRKLMKQELIKNKYVPLRIDSSNITYDALGYPEANIKLTNLTEKRIVSFELSFSCYDAYGDKVNGDFSNSNRFYGRGTDISLESGYSSIFSSSLFSFDSTSKLKNIQIDKVAYSDGTSWKRK